MRYSGKGCPVHASILFTFLDGRRQWWSYAGQKDFSKQHFISPALLKESLQPTQWGRILAHSIRKLMFSSRWSKRHVLHGSKMRHTADRWHSASSIPSFIFCHSKIPLTINYLSWLRLLILPFSPCFVRITFSYTICFDRPNHHSNPCWHCMHILLLSMSSFFFVSSSPFSLFSCCY